MYTFAKNYEFFMKKITILFFFISSLLFAQNDKVEEVNSNKIKVYTPSSSTNSKADNGYKWTVKTDLFGFVSGEFPIIGEYRFAKKLSAEVSAGVTYGLYENFGLFGEYEGSEHISETKAAMGNAFRAGIKFYPSSDYDAIEGWAFGLQLYTRTNNRDYKPDTYSPELDFSNQKDSKTKVGIALTISNQMYYDSNIAIEYFLGIGFANVTHDFLTYDYNDISSNYERKPMTIKETIPNLQLGCRIGFGN